MKKLLTLVLCWLIAFSAMAETTLKAKSALSVAGGYITSQNKVDGSFEDGISSWSASVGTIVKTANTEMQGNYVGVWSGTGTGTLDLLWTSTASNTYELSEQIKLDVPSDYTLCGVVNGVETGCKVLSGYVANKIYKASVFADSILGTSFYLRLKHTGAGAFSATVDDGKIEPFTFNTANLTKIESIAYTGYTSKDGSNRVLFKTKIDALSNESELLSVTKPSNAYIQYNVLKTCNVVVGGSISGSNAGAMSIYHYNAAGTAYSDTGDATANGDGSSARPIRALAGDYFVLVASSTPSDNTHNTFSITAQAISDNVIISNQDGTEPTAFTPTGSWTTNSTYTGTWLKTKDGKLHVEGKVAVSGAPTAAALTINLPNGLQIDTVKLNGTSNRHLGGATILDSGVTYFKGGVYYNNTTSVSLVADSKFSSNNYSEYVAISQAVPMTWASGDYVTFSFEVPIVGWSSSPTLYAMSNRAEVFSSDVSASGVVSNATNNFVTSCTNAAPSVCSLWSSFGVAPKCWTHTLDITKRAEVTATTATTATVARTDTSTAFNLFCHLK